MRRRPLARSCPYAFPNMLTGERFKDGEMPKDSSSFIVVSTLSEATDLFPLSGVIDCALWPLSCTSFGIS